MCNKGTNHSWTAGESSNFMGGCSDTSGSTTGPFIFMMVMDVLTEKEVRGSTMFAVDVVLCGAVAYPELVSSWFQKSQIYVAGEGRCQ